MAGEEDMFPSDCLNFSFVVEYKEGKIYRGSTERGTSVFLGSPVFLSACGQSDLPWRQPQRWDVFERIQVNGVAVDRL